MEKLEKKARRKLELIISRSGSRGKMFIDNSQITNLSMQEANGVAMNTANRNAINASLRAASLSASGGMNPFMFGRM